MSLAISLDTVLQEKVQQIMAVQRLSFDSVVRQALREYVEREEKKMQFQQEAIAAWQDFQQDGLHLTDDEVMAWLETWGTKQETEIPKCHG
ncbi:MAG: CopG family transcriptional regulator [Neisseriaceae bacterium]|nr:CopG family transcriptional regulator [Neisseriaceae bacterium]MBR5675289.1 CopG family transcriptional regulator [Neisseriaceae bacterium]